MKILERLFGKRSKLPRGVEKLLRKTEDPDALLQAIDRLMTENKVRLEQLRRDAFALDASRASEVKKIESGDLSERMENLILDNISRLEGQLDALEGEMRILTTNLEALTSLEGKIREVRAMTLKGFSDEQIEKVLLGHAESKEAYLETVAGAEVEVDGDYDGLAAERERKRAALKAKIMAGKAEREPAQAEPEPEQPVASEPEPEPQVSEPEPEPAPAPQKRAPLLDVDDEPLLEME